MRVGPTPREIAERLAGRIEELAPHLLPAGYRQGAEWRCGSVDGDAGHSLAVRLTGAKSGVWADFSTGQSGDALDLVREVHELNSAHAIAWARRWLGVKTTAPSLPEHSFDRKKSAKPTAVSDYWRALFGAACPIIGTLAESYLRARGLHFHDPHGDVLRFARSHKRRSEDGQLEHHPALLALLHDVRTGQPCGTINIYLRPDGTDRLRDRKGKTSWGRVAGAAVMLSPFEDVALGLTICEGVETGLALLLNDLAPVWCCGGAGNLRQFPVLGGIEALTVAADADEPGQKAGTKVIRRWRGVGREAIIVAPPSGDWADQVLR
jgi:hypothetical protein